MIEKIQIKESKEIPIDIRCDIRKFNSFIDGIPDFLKNNPNYVNCYVEPMSMDIKITRWETDKEYENRIRIIEKDNMTKILCGMPLTN